MEALLHEEVTEVAWEHHDVLIHPRHFVAQAALCLTFTLLIVFVQLVHAKSLQLEYVVLVGEHWELCVRIKSST